MKKEFKLPELGENIATADILKVLVSPGDTVEQDQIILEIETDKATIEVPSDIKGIVKEVLVKQGDKAQVGEIILILEDGVPDTVKSNNKPVKKIQSIENKKADIKEIEQKQITKSAGRSSIIKFKLPDLGENIHTADVLAVKVAEGDKLEKDQIILEIETDKATIEVPVDVSGIVSKVLVKEGDKIQVGQEVLAIESSVLVDIQQTENQKQEVLQEVKTTIPAEEVKTDKEPKVSEPKVYIEERPSIEPEKIAPAAPTVRRFAREIGVDINKVIGTGPGGRISINDVKTYSRELNRQKEARPEQKFFGGIVAEKMPDFSKWGAVEKKDMSNIRHKTAEHLSYAWATIPHVTQSDKADITELEKLRKMYSKHVESAGGKLTVTAVLIKVITSALKTFPQFNSSIDMENSSVIYKNYYNIGIAVDTEFGLLVPVIKNADRKNIIELSVEMTQLAEKARKKKLSLEDMQGGTFTITNLGGIGGTYFTPIINSPEVAIVGVSRSSFEQVYIDGKFETRLMLPLSLSYDHRLIDGADGIRFLRWVIDAIQQPFLMALEG